MRWGEDNFDVQVLDGLNKAVHDAIEERRKWLDIKMPEYGDFQVGDVICNGRTGERLGVVTGLYRYWRDRDDGIRDTSMSIDYRYETSSNCFDNTSRQIGVWFVKGTK